MSKPTSNGWFARIPPIDGRKPVPRLKDVVEWLAKLNRADLVHAVEMPDELQRRNVRPEVLFEAAKEWKLAQEACAAEGVSIHQARQKVIDSKVHPADSAKISAVAEELRMRPQVSQEEGAQAEVAENSRIVGALKELLARVQSNEASATDWLLVEEINHWYEQHLRKSGVRTDPTPDGKVVAAAWNAMMDACRARGIPPTTMNPLFATLAPLHALERDALHWRHFASSPQTALMLGTQLDPNDGTVDWVAECNRLVHEQLTGTAPAASTARPR